MSWNDVTHPRPERSEDELLALVYAKARARGRTKQLQFVGALACAVVLIAGLVGLVGRGAGGDKTQVRAGSGRSSGPARAAAPTTVAGAPFDGGPGPGPVPVPVPAPPLPGVAPNVVPPATANDTPPETGVPAPPPGPAASTDPSCHNSRDPACGPLVWDPPPAPNQPLTVSVSVVPGAPKVGEKVTFRVVVDDPDAPVDTQCIAEMSFGDSPGPSCAYGACPPIFGPWTPVARPGHWDTTFEHVYAAPGTYVATFRFSSSSCDDASPYTSQGEGSATVTVTG